MEKRSLGSLESFLISSLSTKNEFVFTALEAKKILKTNEFSVNRLLFRLTKKKWIERIEKGKYLLLPYEAVPEGIYNVNPFIVAQKLVNPYYVGFWSALNYHGFTEQPSNTIFIASIKQKKELEFQSAKFKFVKLKKNAFFGLL